MSVNPVVEGSFTDYEVASELEKEGELTVRIHLYLSLGLDTNSELLSSTLEANVKAKDTYKIVEFVQQISTQTYLLGVNASIDASRAGKFGKSFEVVAQEIGRLSESTKESIYKIDMLLSYLTSSVSLVTKGPTESTEVYSKQAKDLDEIAAAISELKNTCLKLEMLSESI